MDYGVVANVATGKDGALTQFVAISFGAIEDRICAIVTSSGMGALNVDGMSTREVLAFLWAVRCAQRVPCAFVVFDASCDFEMMLRDLSGRQKDKLFGLDRKAREAAKGAPIYDGDIYNFIDGSLKERSMEAVEYEGLRLVQLPGKIFRLSKPKRKGMALYDIASYFEAGDLNSAAEKFLPKSVDSLPSVERSAMALALFKQSVYEQAYARCESEAKLIVRLAAKVETTIAPLELEPRQWYGPSAIASRCLSKWRARGQAKRLTERNSAHELLTSIDRAYFGGRVEAIKLGTIKDIRLFDLNSAYAYATTLLSQFYRPLRFTRKLDLTQPFSCWLVDYELPGETLLGVLPTRAPGGGVSFRRRGKGYFWQPEVEYLATRYPDCYSIKHGYVGTDAAPVSFGPNIHAMYDYRLGLQAQGDAGQKIIKLALSNLYGKFAQNTGGAYYQCRAWAGWITSYVRRLLLDAVTGIEDRVICFSQDAVHVEGAEPIGISIGNGLGEWKRAAYASGLYLAPGIYDLQEVGANKKATRGSNLDLDFNRIAMELSERQVSELSRAFFVGWQLSQQTTKYERNYLQDISETLQLIPGRLRSRNYVARFDWLEENRSSKINENYSGLMSSRYVPQESSLSLRLKLKDRGWV